MPEWNGGTESSAHSLSVSLLDARTPRVMGE
jgi:hypothetical protein